MLSDTIFQALTRQTVATASAVARALASDDAVPAACDALGVCGSLLRMAAALGMGDLGGPARRLVAMCDELAAAVAARGDAADPARVALLGQVHRRLVQAARILATVQRRV